MWMQLAMVVVALGQAAEPLSLQDCLREALTRHPDLGVVETRLDAARAAKKATRAGYLPSLTVQSSDALSWTGRQEATTRYLEGVEIQFPAQPASQDDSHGFGIYLRQPLFDGLAYWHRPQQAEQVIQRAKLEDQVTREGVALQVVEAYYRLLGRMKSLEVLEQTLELSRGQLELAEARHRLGAASRVDVSKARLDVAQDIADVERQALMVAQGRVTLNQTLGRKASAPLAVLPDRASLPAGSPEESKDVPDSHPQLQINMVDQKIEKLGVEISASRLWPTVSGNLSYTRQDPAFYKVYSRFDQLYQVYLGLTISYPIFEGFATQAAIETAEVQLDRTRLERRQIQQALEAQAEGAFVELEHHVAIRQAAERGVEAAEDTLLLAQERYKIGDGTSLEVRDAQLALTRGRLGIVQAEYDYQIAKALLHHARGDLLKTYLPEEQP